MPNIKIYAEEALFQQHRAALCAALEPIRDSMIRHLGVSHRACQLAILPVIGLPDPPALNAEVQILPAPARTRAGIEVMGQEIRQILHTATGQDAAFRCQQHDPATYVVLR